MPELSVPEIIFSQIWQAGWHARELRTVNGQRLNVIYRGVWTHADGPDFRDALLELDGRLVTGAIELHVRASDWERHGHAVDPSYAKVVLHIVLTNDTRGMTRNVATDDIPMLDLSLFLPGPLESFRPETALAELGDLGARTCLPTLAGGREGEVRAILRREGWRRLTDKQLRFAQALEALPPAEVLYRGVLDGLGLTQNRAGMLAVAERLPVATLEAIAHRHGPRGTLAALLGAGGFLPLSPTHQEMTEVASTEALAVERLFYALVDEYEVEAVAFSSWTLNRVRPGNHPVRRLASLGSLVAAAGDAGLLATYLSAARGGAGDWHGWLTSTRPAIGESRARQIAVNVLAPFLAAYADATGDAPLLEQAGQLWEALPGALDDSIAKATLRQIVGEQRFPIRLAIESQGLHQIGRHGCAQLRCFECPIAMLAVRHEASAV